MSSYLVVMVGAGAVGKSAITLQYVKGKFVSVYDPTIEDSYRKQVTVGKKTCVLDILDTAGQEMYSLHQDKAFQKAAGFIVVYSVTDPASVNDAEAVQARIMKAKENRAAVPVVLVGNKIDLTQERKVFTEEGKELAKSLGWQYKETSAKTGEGVNEAYELLVKSILALEKKKDGQKRKKACTIL